MPEDEDDEDGDSDDDDDYNDENNDNNDDNDDESDDDDECDDDTVDGEASCAEPTKKKRKKTERYLTFMHLMPEAFHCIVFFFYILQNMALGKEGLTRTCQPRKPPCPYRSCPSLSVSSKKCARNGHFMCIFMRIFFGCFYMSIISLPARHMYWSPKTRVAAVANVMPLNRF